MSPMTLPTIDKEKDIELFYPEEKNDSTAMKIALAIVTKSNSPDNASFYDQKNTSESQQFRTITPPPSERSASAHFFGEVSPFQGK